MDKIEKLYKALEIKDKTINTLSSIIDSLVNKENEALEIQDKDFLKYFFQDDLKPECKEVPALLVEKEITIKDLKTLINKFESVFEDESLVVKVK